MRKLLLALGFFALVGCQEEEPKILSELESTEFPNVTLHIRLKKEPPGSAQASAFFTHNGHQIIAPEAKLIINGKLTPLDSTQSVEVVSEGSYVVDIKTHDGINDTEMIPDDLYELRIPDTLVLKRSDNGIAILNLYPHFSVDMFRGTQPVKIVSVNEGLMVIDPASAGLNSGESLYTVSLEISRERKSELSNGMRSVTEQVLKRKDIPLRVE